jgi:hypothetical protein
MQRAHAAGTSYRHHRDERKALVGIGRWIADRDARPHAPLLMADRRIQFD